MFFDLDGMGHCHGAERVAVALSSFISPCPSLRLTHPLTLLNWELIEFMGEVAVPTNLLKAKRVTPPEGSPRPLPLPFGQEIQGR
jgi:hypothetical protein